MSIDEIEESEEWEWFESYRFHYNKEKRDRWNQLRADNVRQRQIIEIYKDIILKLLEDRNGGREVFENINSTSALKLYQKQINGDG